LLPAPFSNSPSKERQQRRRGGGGDVEKLRIASDATRTPPRQIPRSRVSHSPSPRVARPTFRLFSTSGSPSNVTTSNTTAALPSTFLRARRHGRPWPIARKSGVSLVTQSDKHAPPRPHFLRQAAPRDQREYAFYRKRVREANG